VSHVGPNAAASARPTTGDEGATTGLTGATEAPKSWRDVVAAYVGLTKPRVIELLLLTTVPVMFFAERGIPPLGLVVATVVGGALSAGSASAYNCVYDRDIDEQMRRTRRRALPRHIVSPVAALVFATVLAVLSTVVLGVWVNWLSAALSVLANAFYVVVYTMLLKRRTTQNIVWGGLAGCFPALIGWTAVTGELAWTPVVLFLVVFFWTPPHTWALALRYREDYRNVDVPMLPVVKPAAEVARQVVVYSWVMVPPRSCCGRSPGRASSTPSPPPCWAPASSSRRTGCGSGPRRRRPSPTSTRCGSSTPPTSTCRCCS
jgi:protoheme IX farnesyltransferase